MMRQNIGLEMNSRRSDANDFLWQVTGVSVFPAEWVDWFDRMAIDGDRYAAPFPYLTGKESVKHEREMLFENVQLLVDDLIAPVARFILQQTVEFTPYDG